MPDTLPRRTLLGLTALLALPARAEPTLARFPIQPNGHALLQKFLLEVMQQALLRAGSDTRIEPVEMDVSQTRSLLELAQGHSQVDLMWTMTDRTRERAGLIPIRIPLDRGLLGWRRLLVRAADLGRWAGVRSLDDLRRYTAGQGQDWPDTAILKANKLPVVTGPSHAALFRMLAGGRFDYFPRSILEIDSELAGGRYPSLAIAPDLMLHYPAASYLFVGPHRPVLAAELLRGLQACVADGSLARLHWERFGALVRAHPVARERVLHLQNPLLPPETPLNRRELWLQPGG